MGSRPVVKMPSQAIQSSSEPTTSSNADSSESDEKSSPEGKNKRKKANVPTNAPPKKKARSKELRNSFIKLSEKIIDMQNVQAEAMARSQTRAEELMLKLEMEQRIFPPNG